MMSGPRALSQHFITNAFGQRRIGSITIREQLESLEADRPVTIAARGHMDLTGLTESLAIGSLTVGKNVMHAQILAGYNTALEGVNGDASIGKVLVKGDWIASSLAAGVVDATADGFGRNDQRIPTGSDNLLARVASITIKGEAKGTVAADDFYGFTAELFDSVKIAGAALGLTGSKDTIVMDTACKDFRLIEL